MDRREFAALVPALLACGALMPVQAGAETLPMLEARTREVWVGAEEDVTAVYSGDAEGREHPTGEETMQEVGAPHEPVDTHLHNEIWLVRQGGAGVDDQWNGSAHGSGRCGSMRGRRQALHPERWEYACCLFCGNARAAGIDDRR